MSGTRPKVICLGAGGHARVLIESLRRAGELELIGLLDSDESLHGSGVLGVEVMGGDDLLGTGGVVDAAGFVCGVGGVNSNDARRTAFRRAWKTGLRAMTVIDPSAVVSPSALLEAGVFAAPGAVINAGASIGMNAIVNTRAVVEHDARIGEHAHVAPGAVVLGGAEVGEAALVGAGAVVLPGVRVGREALAGAGAVVAKDVAEGAKVMGVPGTVR